MRLTPSVSGIDLSMLQTKGANLKMLDVAIGADGTNLFNGIGRADILNALKQGLAGLVNTHPITYVCDSHGDRHFPGGPQGTKFAQPKNVVNNALVQIIGAELGRIRRDANGRAQTYYTIFPPHYSNGLPVCIQVDYTPGPSETITYHGYPDAGVQVYSLSRSKGGTAISG